MIQSMTGYGKAEAHFNGKNTCRNKISQLQEF